MTPKEKANELIEKFLSLNDIFNKPIITDEQDAVKCAIIAVVEIIYQIDCIDTYLGNLSEQIGFWNEVKSELELELKN